MSTTTISGRASTYLHEMLSVAKRIGIRDDIVRYKFLQTLQLIMSLVIASQKELNPIHFGKLADELIP